MYQCFANVLASRVLSQNVSLQVAAEVLHRILAAASAASSEFQANVSSTKEASYVSVVCNAENTQQCYSNTALGAS